MQRKADGRGTKTNDKARSRPQPIFTGLRLHHGPRFPTNGLPPNTIKIGSLSRSRKPAISTVLTSMPCRRSVSFGMR
jgi:hypothetical protein